MSFEIRLIVGPLMPDLTAGVGTISAPNARRAARSNAARPRGNRCRQRGWFLCVGDRGGNGRAVRHGRFLKNRSADPNTRTFALLIYLECSDVRNCRQES